MVQVIEIEDMPGWVLMIFNGDEAQDYLRSPASPIQLVNLVFRFLICFLICLTAVLIVLWDIIRIVS